MKPGKNKLDYIPPKPKDGKWFKAAVLGTKWNCLWTFRCSSTGFTASIRFQGSDPRPLEKMLLNPVQGVVRHNDYVNFTDERMLVVGKWRPSDGKLTVFNTSIDARERRKHKKKADTVIRAGYGLRQAMRMAFLVLAEEGLLYCQGEVVKIHL